VPAEELDIGIVERGPPAGRDGQAGPLEHRPGEELVVAAPEGHRAGELRERLHCGDCPACVAETQFAQRRVADLDRDAPVERLVDDDPGVPVDAVVALGTCLLAG